MRKHIAKLTPLIALIVCSMNTQTTKRNCSGEFDRKAAETVIFGVVSCRSPIDGRCGVGGVGNTANTTSEQSGMRGYIKRGVWLAAVLLGWLMMVSTVQAASFDCAKAEIKVEKLVCDTPSIFKLDDELSKLYQDIIGKANDEQKQLLITEQKHWLKYTRNLCEDETCLKLAYWSRQAGLATFFEPKSPLYKHEADKAEAIKQVLETAPLFPSYDTPFCRQIFDDLKQMNGIRFVDPVVQTQSYEDSALDKVKQHCGSKPPLHFSRGCLPNIAMDLPTGKEGFAEGLAECDVGFGLPPFKVYELAPIEPTDKSRVIFYADDAYGPMNLKWKKPSLGGGFIGFKQINPNECERADGPNAQAGNGDRDGQNYNSIIEYKNQYYFFILDKPPLSNKYWLSVVTVTPNGAKNQKVCRWVPVAPKPNTSNQGSK
jgi:uncharacterized protein